MTRWDEGKSVREENWRYARNFSIEIGSSQMFVWARALVGEIVEQSKTESDMDLDWFIFNVDHETTLIPHFQITESSTQKKATLHPILDFVELWTQWKEAQCAGGST